MGPTVYELNREVDRWDRENRQKEQERGYGIPPMIRARGGMWLTHMATMLGERIYTVRVNGTPRPAVKYRGLQFVLLGASDAR